MLNCNDQNRKKQSIILNKLCTLLSVMWKFYLTVTGFNLSSTGISFISSCTSVRIFSCSKTHLPSFWFVSSSKVFVVSSSMISATSSKFYTWDSNWLSSSIFFCCPPTSSSSFCVEDSTWVVCYSTSIMTFLFDFFWQKA